MHLISISPIRRVLYIQSSTSCIVPSIKLSIASPNLFYPSLSIYMFMTFQIPAHPSPNPNLLPLALFLPILTNPSHYIFISIKFHIPAESSKSLHLLFHQFLSTCTSFIFVYLVNSSQFIIISIKLHIPDWNLQQSISVHRN